MKHLKKMLYLILALFMVIPTVIVTATDIIPWEKHDNIFAQNCEMEIYHFGGINWTATGFKHFYKNIPDFSYNHVYGKESLKSNICSIGYKDEYFINVSDVTYENNILTFDYTADIDLAPDENGAATYHAMLILFFSETEKREGYTTKYYNYAKENDYWRFRTDADGFQMIKYVAPGTVNGEEMIENGDNISVALPDNFDPAVHLVGYALWRIEDKDIVIDFNNPEIPSGSYISEPRTQSSPIMMFDLSQCVREPAETTEPEATTEPEVTTEPEITTKPEPVPEPEPESKYGDANSDGKINLADASLLMKYIAGWNVDVPGTKYCDLNGNGRIDLIDVSTVLKIIVGWNI